MDGLTDWCRRLVHGTSVRIRGAWAPSPAQGQSHELIAEQIEILGPADEVSQVRCVLV